MGVPHYEDTNFLGQKPAIIAHVPTREMGEFLEAAVVSSGFSGGEKRVPQGGS